MRHSVSIGRSRRSACRGLLAADWREREESLRRPSVQVRLPDGLPLAGEDVAEGDQVPKDEPQQDILAVQAHQGLEQGQRHLTQL